MCQAFVETIVAVQFKQISLHETKKDNEPPCETVSPNHSSILWIERRKSSINGILTTWMASGWTLRTGLERGMLGRILPCILTLTFGHCVVISCHWLAYFGREYCWPERKTRFIVWKMKNVLLGIGIKIRNISFVLKLENTQIWQWQCYKFWQQSLTLTRAKDGLRLAVKHTDGIKLIQCISIGSFSIIVSEKFEGKRIPATLRYITRREHNCRIYKTNPQEFPAATWSI